MGHQKVAATSSLKMEGKSDKSANKKVDFSDVSVFEFGVELGDNPAVREGCPVQLGKGIIRTYVEDIDSYELERGTRLRGKELYIPVQDRAAL